MSADPRGYYAALHLTPEATQAEIQRAFRALVRLRHPDVGSPDTGSPDTGSPDGGTSVPGPPDAGLPAGPDDVRAILAAFAVLRDPRSRAAYDGQAREASPPGAAPPEAGAPGAAPPEAGAPGAGTFGGGTAGGPRDIPVRHHRSRSPVLRVSPVRWERGPWEGRR